MCSRNHAWAAGSSRTRSSSSSDALVLFSMRSSSMTVRVLPRARPRDASVSAARTASAYTRRDHVRSAMTRTLPASERLRAGSDRIWQGLHGHPFITELATGTLPIEKFRFFLEQDNLYLQDYARCLAMGAAKSRDE